MSHCWVNAQKWHSCILQSCIWYKTVDFECIPFQDDENRLNDSHSQWKTVKSMILLYYFATRNSCSDWSSFFFLQWNFSLLQLTARASEDSWRNSSQRMKNILFNRTFPLIRLWECICVDCWNFQGFLLNAFLWIQVFFEKIDEQRSGLKDPTIIRLEHQQIVTIELFRSLSFFQCVLSLSFLI